MTGLNKGLEKKKIKREIDTLKEKFQTTELKPCHSDADLRRKEEDLSSLRKTIHSLEKEINRFAFPIFNCK